MLIGWQIMGKNILHKIKRFLSISQSRAIARRYFVVNGFDGALTMLGMLIGFYITNGVEIRVAITACMGAAIALTMSGLSSAYISESAERKKAFHELQDAMISDLDGSEHDQATRVVPVLIAAVNGLAPLILSLLIMMPLWLSLIGIYLPMDPYLLAIEVAFILIFLLGVFLGRISGTFWLLSGLQSLSIAIITSLLIVLLL
jgi:predicted membrane protein (TIGR00267 family)